MKSDKFSLQLLVTTFGLLFILLPGLKAEVKHDAGKLVLDSARRAYNEQEYGFAAARFQEFLARFATHPELLHAKFGLALTLIDSKAASVEELNLAILQLTEVVKTKEFPERRHALYYLGLGTRRLGESAMAKAKSAEAPSAELIAAAGKHLETAALHFASAAEAFQEGTPAPPDDRKLPVVWEWVVRSKSEQVEMLLRAGKHQEVLAAAEKLLGQKWAQRSRYSDLVRYLHGFSAFRLGALTTAKKSLESIQPSSDPASHAYADHAHYLLGRARHLTGESEGAFNEYSLVVTRYQKAREAAEVALKDQAALKNKPEEKLRLESLVNSPPPAHVERSRYYRGALFFEEDKHEEALKAFTEFALAHPKSSLLPDSLLRKSICLWNLSRYKECMEVLNPLIQGAPRLADEAHLWLGKAQVSAGQSAKPEEQAEAFQEAMENFRKSIEILKPKSATDAAAKKRLSEVLIHQADTQMMTKNYKDAAVNYLEIIKLGAAGSRNAELLYRQATALHLAGEHAESDKLCTKFVTSYPESELLAQILFRMAENGFFQAAALEKGLPPDAKDRSQQIQNAYVEAGKRYQKVVDGYLEFPHLNLARLGLAASLYRQGKFREAGAALAPAPPEELNGELAQGLTLRADCLLRQVPESWEREADRARRDTLLDEAIKLLKVFLGSNLKHPQRPQAMMKLGICYQLKAEPMAQSDARTGVLKLAQGIYQTLITTHAIHPLAQQAVIEKAKSHIAAGDVDGGIAELAKFGAAPLNASPLVPIAALRHSQALRSKNKAAEAVALLELTRKQHEEALLKGGPPRDVWAIHLHFQHGLALKDAGKSAESKAVMEDFLKRYPDRPEAPEASLRMGQAMALDARNLLASAEASLKRIDLNADGRIQAQTERQAALLSYRSCATYFLNLLKLKEKQPKSTAWPRVHYELAWCYMPAAGVQLRAAHNKLKKEAAAKTEADETAAEVPLSAVPVQPVETLMMDQYNMILTTWPNSPVASDARFELADHHASRGRIAAAIPLLKEALTKPNRDDLKEKINFLLGSCLFETNLDKEAIPLFESVIANVSSPLAPHAAFRCGEAYLQLKENDKAAVRFKLFIDQPTFQNLPGLSDRGLLRLGFAQAQQGQHAESQKTCALVITRFPRSPFLVEAQFAQGEALQAQVQFDAAIKAYEAVVDATSNEYAARAQYQIGRCRLEKKLYAAAVQDFLKVVYTYAYPDLSAAALCQAADASLAQKKTKEAEEFLQRVLTEFSKTNYAKLAKEQLGKLPK